MSQTRLNQRPSADRKGQQIVPHMANAVGWTPIGLWTRREFGVLATLAVVASAIWGFAELADAVLEGETHAFDERILLALRSTTDRSDPLGPGWFEELMRDVTALGSMGILTFVTLAVAGFLALDRKTHAALFVLVAVGGGMLLSTLLKIGFDRPRPDLVPHGARVYTASFPSGHAMLAAVVYLTLGALLARVQPRRCSSSTCSGSRSCSRWRSAPAGCISACTGRPTCWPAGRSAPPGRCCAGRRRCGCSARDGSRPMTPRRWRETADD